MYLIPELRENEDVLSHMTFGVIEPTNLKNEFVSVRKKYLQTKTSQNTTAKRKSDAYNKYKQEWLHTTSRKIAGLVKDKDALLLMSQDEKMDYALALEAYSNEGDPNRSLSLQEKGFVNDALQEWKKELGCANGESLEEFFAGQYYQYAQTIAKDEWVENQVNEAIAEYNKTPNPAKQEVESYKEIEAKTAVISDDVADLLERLPQEADPCAQVIAEAQGKDADRLTNRQLVILFTHLLDVGTTPDTVNVTALARLLAKVSGKSAQSMRQTIMQGVDYTKVPVHNDVDALCALVRPISEGKASLIRNSKED